jgi:ABC-type antimicrobial peptide transport system permease subunit
MSMFGFLALATSGVGLYALLSYSVNQRTQEIGIRMALGADDRRVRSLVVREALGSVVAGIVIGTIASYWLTRVLDWQLYHTTPHDPRTYAGVVLILLGVAALAAFLPARRATQVDPVEALRAE